MTDQELIRELEKAAGRWEKENPIVGVGRLQYCDALRDASCRLKGQCDQIAALQAENTALRSALSRAEAKRDALEGRLYAEAKRCGY